MTHWCKKYGDKVGMEHVQEQPHVQLSTSHTHINIPTCGVLRYTSECCGYRIPDAVRLTCA